MEDKGSAVVEMCFAMPVVVAIVFLTIKLFLASVNESIVVGEAYTTLYTFYGRYDFQVEEEKLIYSIDNKMVTEECLNSLDIDNKSDNVNITIYNSQDSGHVFSKEYDACTARLRRWQMYGNIISE